MGGRWVCTSMLKLFDLLMLASFLGFASNNNRKRKRTSSEALSPSRRNEIKGIRCNSEHIKRVPPGPIDKCVATIGRKTQPHTHSTWGGTSFTTNLQYRFAII